MPKIEKKIFINLLTILQNKNLKLGRSIHIDKHQLTAAHSSVSTPLTSVYETQTDQKVPSYLKSSCPDDSHTEKLTNRDHPKVATHNRTQQPAQPAGTTMIPPKRTHPQPKSEEAHPPKPNNERPKTGITNTDTHPQS